MQKVYCSRRERYPTSVRIDKCTHGPTFVCEVGIERLFLAAGGKVPGYVVSDKRTRYPILVEKDIPPLIAHRKSPH